jgi:acyl dehydratase/NAD(P)-dependent dehydrogenase (short-subunit alcohol dehydrogenase family)
MMRLQDILMTDEALASRTFSLDDQIAFARLSSDCNPMHLDQAFARRTQVGAPVVHGIHNLAWAADVVLRSYPLRVANIRARFLQPLYLDERTSVRIRNRAAQHIEFEIVAANTVVALVKLSSRPGKFAAEGVRTGDAAPPRLLEPADLRFEQLAGHTGAVAIGDGDARSSFPALTESIGLPAVEALLATSYIVGMACPGLHSLFAGLDVNCAPAGGAGGALAYAVTKLDARFRSLQIDISSAGLVGRLDAFARPAPPSQPGMAEISKRVTGRPFAGQRSLIVGGSRGLGEVTAKIVAAGGGHPVITYMESKDEVERVAADILGAGGQCEILRYDARSPAAGQLQKLGAVDCCYFFATPRIFQRKSALYEPEKLNAFLRVYVDGFSDLCIALAEGRNRKLAMFYPSTVAIDEATSSTAEYAMAKMAGEILAKHLNEFTSGIHVICRRLPRILTDQTASVGVASAERALDVMLPIVYDVQQMARPDQALRG